MDSLSYYIIKCHIFLTDKGIHAVLSRYLSRLWTQRTWRSLRFLQMARLHSLHWEPSINLKDLLWRSPCLLNCPGKATNLFCTVRDSCFFFFSFVLKHPSYFRYDFHCQHKCIFKHACKCTQYFVNKVVS